RFGFVEITNWISGWKLRTRVQACPAPLLHLCLSVFICGSKVSVPQLFIEELRHQFERLGGFGELEVVPKRVRHGLEDDELRVVARSDQREMKYARAAQQDVSSAGHKQRRRHPGQVGEERRQYRVPPVGFAQVWVIGTVAWIRGLHQPREAVEREQLYRVAGTAEVGEARKEPDRARKRQVQLPETHRGFRAQNRASGRPKDSDVLRLVSLQQLLVNRDDVIY